MEWVFYMGILFCLFDIQGKLNKLTKKEEKNDKKKNNFKIDMMIKDCLGKDIKIEMSDDVNFFIEFGVVGRIVDYDKEWFVFRYYHQSKKKYVKQYFRIKDLKSIDEVKDISK